VLERAEHRTTLIEVFARSNRIIAVDTRFTDPPDIARMRIVVDGCCKRE